MPAELRFSRSDSEQEPRRASVAARRPLDIARWCVSQGWPVHPLAAGRKTPAANCAACNASRHDPGFCACLPEGRWCHGFHAATLDPLRIEEWWGRQPDFGVGVACGPAALVVIDIDTHPTELPSRDRLLPGIQIGDHIQLGGLANGYHTLAVLAALRGQTHPADDASTLRVRTPSGGLHVWYRAADSRRWQCSTGSAKGKGRALAWQVDVRAHGGYIIAPGTTTAAGTYTPLDGARTPAPLPPWLAAELERTGHLPAPAVPQPRKVPPRALQAVIAAGGGRDRSHRVLSTLVAEIAACGQVSEGAGFSTTLNRAAFTLGGLIASGALDQQEAEQALRAAAAAARPGQERRSEGIIRSGLAAGVRRPLYPSRGRRT
ncbi:bifunctional DNA primase/polymerase [Streptomyces sp. TRM 70351]|uniref:bifunctional DNA primase/polymerase n=1 Tax=Streptomyces sp. TRM 70351 TaxID=3116552 RepID=UPI002E7C14E6|nr:bifunctional DNA primase/polymerase [Streptomyces sp. TRM 70351]MEE1931218.1 bifunctional DNA primase/polymerase [Streptomyces sp. TRM 70351]